MRQLSIALILLIIFSLIQCRPVNDNKDVVFTFKTPTIDGRLDADLAYLRPKDFNYIWQFDNPVTDTVRVTYRMVYTPSHLYIYIETDADSVSYHRRGYLWGDGYKVLLGIPQKDSLTNEYYELFFSPTDEKEYERNKQGISYYNFNQSVRKLSNETRSQEKAQRGSSGFEALIAWSDIKPYHPWFMDKIGYNIYFAKGIDHAQHGYITNGYSLVKDEGIWDEEVPKRNHIPISFEDPTAVNEKIILAKPKQNNLGINEPMTLVIAHIDKHRSNEQLTVTFSDMNCNVISSEKINIRPEISLKKEEFKINMGSLKSDRYSLTVQSSKDTILDEPVVILPKIDFQKITQKIQENKGQIKSGTANTLQFELNQISNKLTDLKIYETGEDILMDWKLFREKYELFNSGVDPYKNLTEPYRRAFKSKYDGTYQPYSIKLPVNYDPGKKYPLLVFLHGSGSDEQEQRLLNRSRSGGNFIEIAPLARDIYRAYAEDYSQKDIIEAIDDVAKYFAVDTDNIIIGGFSMGGYGALRTFYEHPNRYKGITVHAGHPDLANEWLDGEHPNFLDDNYLTSFSNLPVFIYHGRKDAAINVDLIEKMSEKLTEAGARVTKRIVEDKGHEYPDEKTNELYFDWLNQTIKN